MIHGLAFPRFHRTTAHPAPPIAAESSPDRVETSAPVKKKHYVRRGLVATSILLGALGTSVAVPNSMLPPPLSSAAHVVSSTLAGEYPIAAPSLPVIAPLNAHLVSQGDLRGENLHVMSPVSQDAQGHHHEPVTVIVEGHLDKLTSLLGKEGWAPPSLFPMTPMQVNGHYQVASLVKNSEAGGMSRDHLRIFDLGKNPANGRQQWGITATRDLEPELSISA
ncbi:MAG TPA: hypothetical protein VGO93_04005, partial [Candidatus Xenobia bacterium]